MKKIALLFLALLALLVSCKEETDFDDDPHVPLVNPFVGVWQVSGGGGYYCFNGNGTGGAATSESGLSGRDDFSFLVWDYTGITSISNKQNTLAIVRGSETDAAIVIVEVYGYAENGDEISLARSAVSGTPAPLDGKTLVRVSGGPEALNVKSHPLLGSWQAVWSGNNNHDGVVALGTWSFRYYTDGTVKTYHHGLHQFENAYLVRNNILVIIGEWRFHITQPPIETAIITVTGTNTVFANENTGTTWDYTRKKNAIWK